ncbi:MAG: hypothetical protein ABMB14_10370 [Myxococcota bacterium]
MSRRLGWWLVALGCGDPLPPGTSDRCETTEDCGHPDLVCVQSDATRIPDTIQGYCQPRCTTSEDCDRYAVHGCFYCERSDAELRFCTDYCAYE